MSQERIQQDLQLITDKVLSFTDQPHVIVVGGPAGCGKTTIGQQLSDLLSVDFVEGDDLHSKENVEKMSKGIPLTDEDRFPWLTQISKISTQHAAQSEGHKISIVSCSMLKKIYREHIAKESPQTKFVFVFLYTSFQELVQRVTLRQNHYMKNDMVKSQYDIMEIPELDEGVSVKVEGLTKEQVLVLVLDGLVNYL